MSSVEELLTAIGERGYHVSLDGPDARMVTPEYRWDVRAYTNETDVFGAPVDRKMFHAATPAEALAKVLAWIDARQAQP